MYLSNISVGRQVSVLCFIPTVKTFTTGLDGEFCTFCSRSPAFPTPSTTSCRLTVVLSGVQGDPGVCRYKHTWIHSFMT